MTQFGRVLFSGSRFIFWTLGVAVVGFLVLMAATLDLRKPVHVGMLLGFLVVGGLLVLGLYDPSRFRWALRSVAAAVFLVYAAYLVDKIFLSTGRQSIAQLLARSSTRDPLIGFALIGIPALVYAWRGRFLFERDQADTEAAIVEQVSDHIERTIGPIEKVFHEIVSDDLHIDVYHVKSSGERPFEVLVTSGMSAKPMPLPAEAREAPRYAEVLAVLPAGWPLTPEAFHDERNYWPVRLLKDLARYPHHNATWLGYGHTIGNGETGQPYADGIPFGAVILLPPASLGPPAWSFRRPDGTEVFFFAAVPLHPSELNFKMERGVDPLLDLFDRRGIDERIDPKRRRVV